MKLLVILAAAGWLGYNFLPGTPHSEHGRLRMSYDSRSGEWIILRDSTFNGVRQVKRMTAVCSFYKHGNSETVTGAQACDLQVGTTLVPNTIPRVREKSFLDIYEMSPDRLSIMDGEGPDSVIEQFTILKQEVVQ